MPICCVLSRNEWQVLSYFTYLYDVPFIFYTWRLQFCLAELIVLLRPRNNSPNNMCKLLISFLLNIFFQTCARRDLARFQSEQGASLMGVKVEKLISMSVCLLKQRLSVLDGLWFLQDLSQFPGRDLRVTLWYNFSQPSLRKTKILSAAVWFCVFLVNVKYYDSVL